MKRFACCPVCAHKLCKGEKGCYLDIKCPRGGEVIHIKSETLSPRALFPKKNVKKCAHK